MLWSIRYYFSKFYNLPSFFSRNLLFLQNLFTKSKGHEETVSLVTVNPFFHQVYWGFYSQNKIFFTQNVTFALDSANRPSFPTRPLCKSIIRWFCIRRSSHFFGVIFYQIYLPTLPNFNWNLSPVYCKTERINTVKCRKNAIYHRQLYIFKIYVSKNKNKEKWSLKKLGNNLPYLLSSSFP